MHVRSRSMAAERATPTGTRSSKSVLRDRPARFGQQAMTRFNSYTKTYIVIAQLTRRVRQATVRNRCGMV